ncbi:MAG TPA: tryptophan synthase subunit alpha, partial [Burkholderiaceae bacterium]|nr:tryptophan synthase subunit alpha [Burkholderiaceae bacterium]
MSRIAATFERLSTAGRCALIPYFTAGHPTRELAVPMMHALAAAGADVIELGVPFSDPMADGPVIQKSGEHALSLGVGLGDVLDWVRTFRRTDDTTPVVLMGYLNPIERMGAEAFAAQLESRPFNSFRGTSISGALTHGTALLQDNGFSGWRQVIDVS